MGPKMYRTLHPMVTPFDRWLPGGLGGRDGCHGNDDGSCGEIRYPRSSHLGSGGLRWF
jgi:hypothetical protein